MHVMRRMIEKTRTPSRVALFPEAGPILSKRESLHLALSFQQLFDSVVFDTAPDDADKYALRCDNGKG